MPYFNDAGELNFRFFPAHEILPFWSDDEHTELDIAVRAYVTSVYVGRTETYVQHVDIFRKGIVAHYVLNNGVPRTTLPDG